MVLELSQLPDGRAIVIENHTLGVKIGNDIQILRSSILRGSPYPLHGCIAFPMSGDVRLANEADFQSFGVVSAPSYFVGRGSIC